MSNYIGNYIGKHSGKYDRRVLLGVAAGAIALLLALSVSGGGNADAKTAKKKAPRSAAAGKVLLFSCTPDFDKRPANARLLQKDSLNSGAWIIPGIDPEKAPNVTIWSCKLNFIEPSGQLRPFWRKKQSPPLPPAQKFDVCEPVTVTKMAKDRLWFGCTENHVIRVRIDE